MVSYTVIEDVYHALLDLQIEEMEYEYPGIISYPGLRKLMLKRYEEGKVQVKGSISGVSQVVKVMEKEGKKLSDILPAHKGRVFWQTL